ncbi:hypothetical protein JG688_00014170 [Phytophthora aleatoria]|uniref:Uncharacterized protein n=1 Tax=Phytophthora aleatoria TaxID=2496075 RepID=A0A8J5ILD8_9STRA|nr:hypothetical protein JG688_00014170 [Phytophthora aleatoria]
MVAAGVSRESGIQIQEFDAEPLLPVHDDWATWELYRSDYEERTSTLLVIKETENVRLTFRVGGKCLSIYEYIRNHSVYKVTMQDVHNLVARIHGDLRDEAEPVYNQSSTIQETPETFDACDLLSAKSPRSLHFHTH